MTFWEFVDRRLPGTREVMAFALVGLFMWAFDRAGDPAKPVDQLLMGAVITAFSTAYGFYLGGSKVGSETAEHNARTLSATAKAAIPTTGNPLPVEVKNAATDPVPVDAGHSAGPQAWTPDATYKLDDRVTLSGHVFRALQDVPGRTTLDNPDYWEMET